MVSLVITRTIVSNTITLITVFRCGRTYYGLKLDNDMVRMKDG